jgi:hypothetical protein
MDDNRYAPPKAMVDDAGAGSLDGPAPALWNPNAAVNWCLLFSPVFGTWLHWKNWQALGEQGKARSAMGWLVAAVAVLVISMVVAIANEAGGRAFNFLFLLVWYFAAAKAQAKFVKERYGDRYPRRGWLLPIGIALGAFVVLVFGVMAVAFAIAARA